MLDSKIARTAMSPEALLNEILQTEVEGISLLGGEPFAQAGGLASVAEGARAAGLSVMVFSGHLLTQLRRRAQTDPGVARLLAATDLLVDGPYLADKRTTTRRYIGSDNQGLHFLTDRYRPDDPRFSAPNHLELHLSGGVLTVNGYPILGARTQISGVGKS